MSLSLKKDDTIIVLSGKEAGKKGKILKISRETSRAIVEKLNIVKRHAKPTKTNPQGGVVQKEAGIHISNLLFYCTKCTKGVRLGTKIAKDGTKTRICRKCGEGVDKVK